MANRKLEATKKVKSELNIEFRNKETNKRLNRGVQLQKK